MGFPPIVTGISPKEGPPGTRVTIRGENFGSGPEDITGLFINEVDCLMFVEWISSNKIVARSGSASGRGDIIIVTKSGGSGSCTVQFKGFLETTGPLKESAVWVDESHLPGLGRHRALISSSQQQEDPLGISVENAGERIPEEELQDLFPDSSGDLGSENFSPSWFLLRHHRNTGFDDLKSGLSHLKRKVEGEEDGQITFLKAHAGSVIEQMDTLLSLKDMVEKNKSAFGADMTRSLEQSILRAKVEADRLFEDVLKRKDQADGTRNALGVLQRFRFLFHLPAALDKNINKADYDLVINDYARAKALFGKTEVQVFQRVLQEADHKIHNLRQVLQQKLQTFPSSLEDQKKIIRNLVNLETNDDPAWSCLLGQYKYNSQVLFSIKDTFLSAELEENSPVIPPGASKGKKNGNGLLAPPEAVSVVNSNGSAVPGRINFLEELSDNFLRLFPDLWKLGKAYFAKELVLQVDDTKKEEMNRMAFDIISIYTHLIRSALIPQTLDRQSPHRARYGMWPSFTSAFSDQEGIGSWFVPCLRTVRQCYATLLSLGLSDHPLDVFRDLLHDLRVNCMRSFLVQTAENVTSLVHQETWKQEFVAGHGSITPVVHKFERQMTECLQLIKETAFEAEQRETELTNNAAVLNELNHQVGKCLVNFARGIERVAINDQESTDAVCSREVKLLLALSNCHYAMLFIIPRLKEHWTKLGYPDMSSALQSVQEMLTRTDESLLEAYLEEKVEPLIGIVEPSMYAGRFDWHKYRGHQLQDVRPYCKEIIINVIAVHAEVALICPLLVPRILERVVQEVAAELGRLFSCVKTFSEKGALQARADIAALTKACQSLAASDSLGNRPPRHLFAEADKYIPALKKQQDQENFDQIMATFEKRMKFQLVCLNFNAV